MQYKVASLNNLQKEGLALSLLLFLRAASFGLSLAFPFVFCVMVPAMGFLLDILCPATKHKGAASSHELLNSFTLGLLENTRMVKCKLA
jgi:hypothetical protein